LNISIKNLSFSYTDKLLLRNLSLDFEGGDRPIVILGSSGSGKTTLLKLLGGLLKPQAGDIIFSQEGEKQNQGEAAFMFQESRLLPWLTVLDNVSLPLKKTFGVEGARERARYFLSLVSLAEKETAYPDELSGGQAQRVSMARAFAWPAAALFMDEPFQSLDIPLRINLMDNCLSLLAEENSSAMKRLLIAVTHDPREAVYMGGRIIVLGKPGEGITYDEKVDLQNQDRVYGSVAALELEREIIKHLARDGE